ncbi:MAG: tetratricopeptide repeat protein [Candidatus Eiseniibacteriota bacterium]|nr:MAG: tetratricopeptide repeat protein [Candidatus Eisenbacteria bacterium]
MAVRRVLLLCAIAGLLLATSCDSHRGLSERYRAEREFFVADRAATRILKDSALRGAANARETIRLFDRLVAKFPQDALEDGRMYSDTEASALKRIVWKSSVRAAGLVSLSGDGEEAARRYVAISERFGGDRELGSVSLYLGARAREATGEWDVSLQTYEEIVNGFLSGRWSVESFDQRLMEVPFLMARLIEVSPDGRTVGDVMEKGRAFYRWTGERSPELALYSRLSEARTYAREGRWTRHVSMLRELLGSSQFAAEDVRPLVLLDVARAYAEGLQMPDSALSYCSVLERDYPSHAATAHALFIRASVLRERGSLEEAKKILQMLAGRRSDVSASAMLELGALYESQGKWEDARAQYGSLRGFFPHSVHNYEALLRVITHYRESGDRAAMLRAADEAVQFLREEIATLPESQAALVARGFLVDAHIIVGRTREAAEELEAIAGLYGNRASGVLALLKAARMHEEAGAREKARQLLAEFEERYGKTAIGERLESTIF